MPGPLPQTIRLKNLFVSWGIPRKCISVHTPFSRKVMGYDKTYVHIMCPTEGDYKKVADILIKHKKEIVEERLRMSIDIFRGRTSIHGVQYDFEMPFGVFVHDYDKNRMKKSERDSMWWNNVKEWEETRPVGEFGEDYNLVCVDYEVVDILWDIGREQEIGQWPCLFVKVGDGYYKEVWGVKTNVPKNTSTAYLLYRERGSEGYKSSENDLDVMDVEATYRSLVRAVDFANNALRQIIGDYEYYRKDSRFFPPKYINMVKHQYELGIKNKGKMIAAINRELKSGNKRLCIGILRDATNIYKNAKLVAFMGRTAIHMPIPLYKGLMDRVEERINDAGNALKDAKWTYNHYKKYVSYNC